MVRPEQSKVSGPAAPHWYGLPSWVSAQLAATSPWLADAPELDAQDGDRAWSPPRCPPRPAAAALAAAAAAAAARAACRADFSAATCAWALASCLASVFRLAWLA